MRRAARVISLLAQEYLPSRDGPSALCRRQCVRVFHSAAAQQLSAALACGVPPPVRTWQTAGDASSRSSHAEAIHSHDRRGMGTGDSSNRKKRRHARRFFSEIEEYVAWCFQHHEQHFGGETPKPPVELTQARLEAIKLALRRMPVSGWVAEAADKRGVSPRMFPTVLSSFRRMLLAGNATLTEATEGSASPEAHLAPADIEDLARVQAAASLRAALSPTEALLAGTAYPKARSMKRKIIYHAGPTNSGKTHTALQRLQGAKSGVYCGPLRLLAMEVYDSCNGNGTFCSLITGQERREVPFARHVSCTVEMANVDEPVDVAVIDEIQLMADEDRGWAWTRALFGVPAKEVHVCGDVSCLPLVRRFAEALGEELEECHYERFTPLVVEQRSLEGSFEAIRPGDAVIAFSKRSIFNIRAAIESSSGHKCCVIYGALPPETRRRQANMFNDADSGYDVLVASDAVGLGLNLNIRRVVFTSLTRPDGPGQPMTSLAASMVKQIAGRAGRRGSRWGTEGSVTTLMPTDLMQVQAYLAAPMPSAAAVGVMASQEHLEAFSQHFPGLALPQLLEKFAESAHIGGPFFLCKQEDLVKAAQELEAVPGLPIGVRLQFATAPVTWHSAVCSEALLRYAKAYASGGDVPMGVMLPPPLGSQRGRDAIIARLSLLEETHQALGIYLWLAQRMGRESFSQCAEAEELARQVIRELDHGLDAVDASAAASSSDAGAAALREKLVKKALGIPHGRPGAGAARATAI